MRIKQIPFLIIVFCLLQACSSATKIESDLGIKGAPDWVNEGSQAVSDKGGRLLHGMGSAPSLGDQALQRSTADNRARAEIARVISSYMDVVMEDYSQASTQSEQTVLSSDIRQDIQTVSKVVLSGAKIIGRWKDKRTDIIYSFAELDLKKLNQAISTSEKFNKNLKDYMQSNSEIVFDKFVKENNL